MKTSFWETYFCCPTCHGDLDFSSIDGLCDTDLISKTIPCSSCRQTFVFQDGVLDFVNAQSAPNKVTEKKDLGRYDEFWNESSDLNYYSCSEEEQRTFEYLNANYNEFVIADIGCGNGRHIPLLAQGGGKLIFCVDSSEAIYEVKNRFGFKYNDTKILYVRCDVSSLCFRDNSIDILWAFGLVNFFQNQSLILKRFGELSRQSIVLGLTSKNIWGTIYKNINIVRGAQKRPALFAVLQVCASGLATFLILYGTFVSSVGMSRFAIFRKFLSYPKPILALKMALLEPFVSPVIFQEKDSFYSDILKEHSFRKISKNESFLVDIFCFKSVCDCK